jgi:hypothetical protein
MCCVKDICTSEKNYHVYCIQVRYEALKKVAAILYENEISDNNLGELPPVLAQVLLTMTIL